MQAYDADRPTLESEFGSTNRLESERMKLSVKTLTNEQFSVEVADSATVLAAKSAIEAVKGEAFAASLQKLIHAGKVLKVCYAPLRAFLVYVTCIEPVLVL